MPFDEGQCNQISPAPVLLTIQANRSDAAFELLLCLAVVLTFTGLSGCGRAKSDSSTPAEKSTSRKTADSPLRKEFFELGGTTEKPGSQGGKLAFRDVATSAGIRFRRFSDIVLGRFFLPEVMGGGVAWLDFDRDGKMDLYAVNGCRLWDSDPQQSVHVSRLFRNLDGKQFADVAFPSNSAANRYGQGVAAGDFNGDGFPDLHLSNFGANVLLVNNGDGTFDDVTQSAGVGDPSWSTSAVWFDADGDGQEDLYVVNYVDVTRDRHKVCQYNGKAGYCGPGSWNGVEDRLYVNLGDGRFQESARRLGIDSTGGKGLAVIVSDFDEDQRPEIYVANDMVENFLFTRSPTDQKTQGLLPRYHNVAERAACARSEDGRNEASMGIASADFDGDGRPDIFLTHFYQSKNTLYRNLGNLFFADDSKRMRIAAISYNSLGFGTVAADFDRDGDADLFIANGHVLGPAHNPYEMKPQLLENDGRGLFSDVSGMLGGYFHEECLGRGAAVGDFNNDGLVDVAVSHVDRPLALLKNETNSPFHFIGLELLSRTRTTPVGARVTITAGSEKRTFTIVGGGSYLSTNDPRLLVGLKNLSGSVQVEVIWPGGEAMTYGPLERDRYWLIREQHDALPAAKGATL